MKCVHSFSNDWMSYATVAGFPLSSQAVTAVHGIALKRESPSQVLTPKALPQTLEPCAAVKDTLSRRTPTRWDLRV